MTIHCRNIVAGLDVCSSTAVLSDIEMNSAHALLLLLLLLLVSIMPLATMTV